MRFIHNIEFIIRNLVDDEFKDKIDNLKRSYPDAFVEGGIGKRGGLSNNFGARYILNNNTEGLIVFHKLVELSKGLYEAYARLYVTDADMPKIRYCNGQGHHHTIESIFFKRLSFFLSIEFLGVLKPLIGSYLFPGWNFLIKKAPTKSNINN